MNIRLIFLLLFVIASVKTGVSGEAVRIEKGAPRIHPSSVTIPDESSSVSLPGNVQESGSVQPLRLPEAVVKKARLLPDLSISGITVLPDSKAKSGGPAVTVELRMKNSGDSALHNVVLRFRVEKQKYRDKRVTIAARSEITVKETLATGGLGRFSVRCVIDPDNKIQEANENNNEITTRASLGKPSINQQSTKTIATPKTRAILHTPIAQPRINLQAKRIRSSTKEDLRVAEVKLNKKQFYSGERYMVLAKITSTGVKDVVDSRVSFKIDGKLIEKKRIKVPSKGDTTVLFKSLAGKAGVYRVSISVSSVNRMKEKNVINNVSETMLNVLQPMVVKTVPQGGAGVEGRRSELLSRNSDIGMKTATAVQPLRVGQKTINTSYAMQRRLENPDMPIVETKMVPLASPMVNVISPQRDSTWINNKSYEIRWLVTGETPQIDKIILKKVGSRGSITKDITPKTSMMSSGKNGTMSFFYKVPADLEAGPNYRIIINATILQNGKRVEVTGISEPFTIIWAVNAIFTEKVVGVDMIRLAEYAKNSPHISYFKHTETVHNSGNLTIDFFWSDSDGDLLGGFWTLESFEGGVWHKKTLKFSDYHKAVGTQFIGVQGLAQIKIPFTGEAAGTAIRFYITDKSGKRSNVMTGSVNAPEGIQIAPPATIKNSFEFVAPSGKNGMSVDGGPAGWIKPGDVYAICFTTKVVGNVATIPVELELNSVGGSVGKIASIQVPNDGSMFCYSWKVPSGLEHNKIYVVSASIPLVSQKPFFSGRLVFADFKLDMWSPLPAETYQTGDSVTFGWQVPVGAVSGEALNFYYLVKDGQGYSVQLNKAPVPVSNKKWQWKIDPGMVLPGPGVFVVRSSKYVEVAVISVNIVFPGGNKPLTVKFSTPVPGRKTQWLAGVGGQIVEWRQSSGSGSSPDVILDLYPVIEGSGPVIPVDFLKGGGLAKGSSYIKIPSNTKGGMYHIVAKRGDLGVVVGKSEVVEIVPNKVVNSMKPPADTKFNITGVRYNYVGDQASIQVQADSSKAFRLGESANQKLVFKISNFKANAPAETAVMGKITNLKHAGKFPSWIFPKGNMGYTLRFTPQGNAPVSALKTSKGLSCWTTFYPKLEIWLETTLGDGRRKTVYFKKTLNKFSGMTKVNHTIPEGVNQCPGELEW